MYKKRKMKILIVIVATNAKSNYLQLAIGVYFVLLNNLKLINWNIKDNILMFTVFCLNTQTVTK